ncbi:PLP-dependent aminotransferase family protein [[Pseudomonas] boreopolis]|uniref:aminotransferase-like domain-containing protein n=1 Tax=Xanthomonas boreopolis TaxID=86183 RepID=UPI003D9B67A2
MAERTGAKTAAVMEQIRAKIASRAFAAGDRLPSIRSLADAMAVSPATVVEAYDRLAAEGWVHARRGSGFYIAASALPPLDLARQAGVQERVVDPFWVSRQALDAERGALKPGCGWLPADWMPAGALRSAFRALARADAEVLTDYGGTQGAPALRRLLLARFGAEGIEAAPNQLLLTASGTQALDLVCRFLLRPGDTVLVDDPCYFNFRALLRVHQVALLGVPYTPTGPDMARFEAILASERPRLYITNSALHNPTGATLSPQVAHRLLNAAARHGLTIVEDDIFADFEPEPSPRLAALDGLDRVVRIGSFSKTLSASLRCGYIAARADWVEALVDLQVATGFGGPGPAAAETIAHVLAGGGYRKHMDQLRLRLLRARRDVAARLRALGIEPWLMPRGGFYLWCRLPEGLRAVDVAKAALAENIVLAPGDVFSVSAGAPAFLRFNVAQSGDPRIWETLRRIVGPGARTAGRSAIIPD